MKAALLAIWLLGIGIASAGAQTPPLALAAGIRHAGRINLSLSGPPVTEVDVTEGDRAVAHVTLDAQGHGKVARAGTWACPAGDRTYTANGTAPDGTPLTASVTVRTPSCAHRYAIAVRPRRPSAGRPVTVTVRDRFHLPREGHVCARGPTKTTECAPLHGRAARLDLRRTGRWDVTFGEARKRIVVRRRPSHLRLLATGDSMIQIVDGFLEQRLAREHVSVRSDARISTGLSKPRLLNWPRHARRQITRLQPDLTIVFIGANDGYPFGKIACCGKAWRRHYAKIAGGMMRTYARDGAGTVFWCLLPAPRDATFRRVFAAVNRALRRAARHQRAVHLVDLPRTFTPGYRFRRTIDGTVVRQDDGVHLSVAGASIGANVIIRALHRAGAL